MNKKNIKSKKVNMVNSSNILFVDIQIVLTVLVLILFIVSLFVSKILIWLELVLGLTLLIMSYNNQKIYKRKKATILYLIFAIIILIFFILMLVGVI